MLGKLLKAAKSALNNPIVKAAVNAALSKAVSEKLTKRRDA